MLKVGLMFHSANSDNLGVGALTVSQVEILRGISQSTGVDIEITIFDWAGARPPYVEGKDIRIETLTGDIMKTPRRLMALLKTCDMIIDIGAGDSFADIYGLERLRRMIYLKYLAHVSRLPVVLAPQTFGPFTSIFTRFIARDLVKRAAVVATRDLQSTVLLKRLAPKKDVVSASDVAIRLTPSQSVVERSKTAVGINVSGLLMNGGYGGQNDFALNMDYPQTMRGLIRRFLALPDAPEVILIPHVISPSMPEEDDLAACRALHQEFPQVTVAPEFASPGQAKAFIGSLDFVTGARMHACIAAFSSGVPVVPLAYSKKFEGMFGSLDYDATADCCALSGADVIEAVIDGFQNRAELRFQVQISLGIAEQRLRDYTDALTRIVSTVALRKKTREQAELGTVPRWKSLDERL